MRQVVLVVVGVAAAVAGIIWTLQGLGYVGGSFMSGATVWAVIGPVVALAGLVLIAAGSRRRRRNS
jgi:MYXO-CTERM domain-containing protein